MTEFADYETSLHDRFAALAVPDGGDWQDVRSRARRMQVRRLGLLAAAVALAALVATPAFGVGSRLLGLVEGTPAPPEVQSSFAASDRMRERLFAYEEAAGEELHDRYSPVIASDARGIFAIDSPDGPIYLWAASTEDGRQCWLVQSGAEAATGRPYGVGSCDPVDPGRSFSPTWGWTAERPSVLIVDGRTYDDSITQVEVEVENGAGAMLPVVSGYFLGTLPKGTRLTAIIARDADGDEVDRVARPD